MRIYFVRHAEAVDRNDWEGEDMSRPLTKDGIKKFKSFFKKIYKNIKKPELIICSEALRSNKTAEIIGDFFKLEPTVDQRINPGADILQYKTVVSELEEKEIGTVLIVGHEPDLSNFISLYISEKTATIKMKKGAFCHIKDRVLYNLIQPDMNC
ncbi:MAG: histidine phosphatase family protein [Calditerrivibrio sp.]|nr:histidine phosphatase family protein [Calditerrivibrio sp.]